MDPASPAGEEAAMTIAHTLKSCLDREHVPYEVIVHRHTATSLRAAETAHVDAGRVAKAVLLEEDLEHSHYVMAVLPATHRVVLPEVARRIGRQVHLATEEDAAGLFEDCETGAIPAVGPAYGVETFVDDNLIAQPELYFEAGDHEHLVRMKTADFMRLLGDCPHGRFGRPA
jgi:Ala-tRNA(Pro) deacylase